MLTFGGDGWCRSLLVGGLTLIRGENLPPIGDGGEHGVRRLRIGGVSGRYCGVGGAVSVCPIARGGDLGRWASSRCL